MRDEEWFKAVCEEFESRYGFGWKKKLADVVGVSASNVQSWIKAGRVPPAVATAIIKDEEIENLKKELSRLNVNSTEVIVYFKGDNLPYKVAVKNEEKLCYEIVASFHNETEAHHWLERREREFLLSELSYILEQWDYHNDPSIKEKVLRAHKLLTSALEQKKRKQSFKKESEIFLDGIIAKSPNKENEYGK